MESLHLSQVLLQLFELLRDKFLVPHLLCLLLAEAADLLLETPDLGLKVCLYLLMHSVLAFKLLDAVFLCQFLCGHFLVPVAQVFVLALKSLDDSLVVCHDLALVEHHRLARVLLNRLPVSFQSIVIVPTLAVYSWPPVGSEVLLLRDTLTCSDRLPRQLSWQVVQLVWTMTLFGLGSAALQLRPLV